ncbi:DNA/RNA non-specific endonuclease [Dyella sp.]|uniref:DNA/RNA non-specific endonuclease n=1 Tax=Dyella sp. TaxID=1869338 RepID=UPI002ED0AB2E
MLRVRQWLFAASFFVCGASLASTACPNFFVNGSNPSIDASLTTRTTEVCHTEYVLLASGVTKGPLYSAQHITAAQVAGADSISRTGSFHQETAIPAADRSQTSDYTNSGFDRGHMTPAGDESTIDSEKESFSMANIVPQDHKLNTGEWAKIEAKVRDLATNLGEVYVVTGPAFDPDNTPTIGKDQVAVPQYTWKAVYEPGKGAAAYLCQNDDSITCDVVSLNDIKTLSGVDPFPALSSSDHANPISLPLP